MTLQIIDVPAQLLVRIFRALCNACLIIWFKTKYPLAPTILINEGHSQFLAHNPYSIYELSKKSKYYSGFLNCSWIGKAIKGSCTPTSSFFSCPKKWISLTVLVHLKNKLLGSSSRSGYGVFALALISVYPFINGHVPFSRILKLVTYFKRNGNKHA